MSHPGGPRTMMAFDPGAFKGARFDAGLTLEALGRLARTSPATLRNWEAGRNVPSAKAYRRVSDVLLDAQRESPPDWLWRPGGSMMAHDQPAPIQQGGEPGTPVARSCSRCILCGVATKGFLEVVPTCAEHCRYGLVEEYVSQVNAAMARWIKARDALATVNERRYSDEDGFPTVQLWLADMTTAYVALDAAAVALEALARRVVSNG